MLIILGFTQISYGMNPVGHWKFSEMIYQGQTISIPNPDLNLVWTFFSNGTERLYWDRGTPDFCERWSHYTIDQNQLTTEVFALNPKNSSECGKDPDMQVGKISKVKLEIFETKIYLYFQLSDEQLIYVLKKQNL